MRIVVDARMMGPENTRGIGRYIKEMIRAMLPLLRDGEKLVLLERAPDASPFRHNKVDHVRADIPWYGMREQLEMPRVIGGANPDVFWAPHWNVPLLYRGPLTVTIHDLLLMHAPDSAKASTRNVLTRWIKRVGYRLVLRSALKRAERIFVPTNAVAEDVVSHVREVSRIQVTGEGMTELPTSVAVPGLPDRYLLYVGSAYPHKNLALLLEAWKSLSKEEGSLSLVIAGEKDVFMQRMEALAHETELERVRFLGRVSDAELSYVYEHAAAFVFPTSFEGFGLPPLEALSRGCPVIASDIPVLKETLPEQGVAFFQNGRSDDMIRAIKEVLEAGESARVAARLGGDEARARHDWNRAAKQTLAALRASLNRNPHASKTHST